jgi:hypothetical protein
MSLHLFTTFLAESTGMFRDAAKTSPSKMGAPLPITRPCSCSTIRDRHIGISPNRRVADYKSAIQQIANLRYELGALLKALTQ